MVTENISHLSNIHAPYTNIKHMTCSFTPFLYSLIIMHSLGTHERQGNGMLVLLIFSIHKIGSRLPLDVMSLHSTRILACVQMVYCGPAMNVAKICLIMKICTPTVSHGSVNSIQI